MFRKSIASQLRRKSTRDQKLAQALHKIRSAKITAETRVEENVKVMTGGSVVEVMVTLVPEKQSMLLEFILRNMSRPASRSSKKLLSSLVFGIPESKT